MIGVGFDQNAPNGNCARGAGILLIEAFKGAGSMFFAGTVHDFRTIVLPRIRKMALKGLTLGVDGARIRAELAYATSKIRLQSNGPRCDGRTLKMVLRSPKATQKRSRLVHP